MTAAEALHNLATDLAELEKRGSVRPGYIAARRREHQAIATELADLATKVQHLTDAANQEHELRLEAELRMGMLANVITILGHEPMVHLRRPLYGKCYTNPDVYRMAAEHVHQDQRRAGWAHKRSGRRMPITWAEQAEMLNSALWSARLSLMLQPFQYLIDKHHHGQEEHTAG